MSALLQLQSPLFQLPPEIYEQIGLDFATGETPQEAARNTVLLGKVCVLSYQLTQQSAFNRVIHRGRFAIAADALAQAIKNTQNYDPVEKTGELYTFFKKGISPKIPLGSEEYIKRAFAALHDFKAKFTVEDYQNPSFQIEEVLKQFSKRIIPDLVSRAVCSPLKEMDEEKYWKTLMSVTRLFAERQIIEFSKIKWLPIVHAIMHAEMLGHHTLEEINALFQQHRDRARALCIERMPKIYEATQALEKDYISLVGLDGTGGEIARIDDEMWIAKEEKDTEKSDALLLQLVEKILHRVTLARETHTGEIRDGILKGYWDILNADPEIKEAKNNAGFFHALFSWPCDPDEKVDYKKFFARIHNFMLQ